MNAKCERCERTVEVIKHTLNLVRHKPVAKNQGDYTWCPGSNQKARITGCPHIHEVLEMMNRHKISIEGLMESFPVELRCGGCRVRVPFRLEKT